MTYSLGADIGSVNAKLALIDENKKVVFFDAQKIVSGPGAAISLLLERLSERYDIELITSAGVTGSGKTAIPKESGWVEYSGSLAIAAGTLLGYPDAKTIIQIGGQSSLVITLEDGLKKPWKVVSNPLCAAGTGRFMEQQAYRLGISMNDFADLALSYDGIPPRIAARCSVFAKTDLIHLQQKGVAVEAMLYALCESIARMVISLKKGTFEEPVFLVGGVAANGAIKKALEGLLSARNVHPVQLNIPANYQYVEALGAALLSVGKKVKHIRLSNNDTCGRYLQMPALKECGISNSDSHNLTLANACNCYLGVDIGSTSTKAVLLDDTGKVVAKHYLMTSGRPVDAVKELFRHLIKKGGKNAAIVGAGVTGSGRYLIGSLIGADLVKNEITAQTRAAAEVDPEADIIEIGGQDSKLVIKRHGIVVDYQMNKACAAGTGSFIDELAEMLEVSVKNSDFASLAFKAPHTIDLGTRCAAFMGQAVASAQQEKVPLEIITASLANAIAKNYISKVVSHRKLGDRVILTGAVFYNQAVVSAFNSQLEGKTITVPEHKEVTGAIGAALLAKEAAAGSSSNFRGFQEVIDSNCDLSMFICKGCDNNCTITKMQIPGEKPTFYGSRCDRYDSTTTQSKVATSFDDREELLFRDYKPTSGSGLTVGIPRTLLVYDFAPLLIGFLNELGTKVILSDKTTKEIIEKSVELGHADSCFPVKLAHGHVSVLKETDYILFPCAIRLGKKEGEENQKYACPLVQASPFIIKHVLDLEGKVLAPILDFSQGDGQVIKNMADAAVQMGFSATQGRKAAIKGLESQRRFEVDKLELGSKLLNELKQGKKLGVVLFARSYMSQDAGANMGIAEKLAQLGVITIPLDFLPLSTVSPGNYSDRPYWFYEGSQIAGAAITANDPQLFGLVLTNFGCGPNSFILSVLEDIMGGKPMGQLEIDEHAAEAGIVTRLEAFVDTINSYARASIKYTVIDKEIYRGTTAVISSHKTLLIPRMAPHADVVAAAMRACGADAMVLPEPTERNLLYSEQVTSGTECLPYRVTLGDFLRFYYDNGKNIQGYEGFAAGSYGPCRLGKYAIEQIRVFRDVGFDLPIRTTVSNNAYRDLNLGPDFERLAWRGIVAIDYLQRLVWHTRPYEVRKGSADELFGRYLSKITLMISKKRVFNDILKQATSDFRAIIDTHIPAKPLIGINGEIYLRSNCFSNSDLVRVCEQAGLEVQVAPMGEWLKYTSYRNLEDAITGGKFKKILASYIKKWVQEHDEQAVARYFAGIINGKEPSTAEILHETSTYLSPKCGSEAVLSIGSGLEWLKSPGFAGVISVMPHGCMPGGIVAAMADKFSAIHDKPWISLTYDGFLETNNLSKINAFAEVIKFCSNSSEQKSF